MIGNTEPRIATLAPEGENRAGVVADWARDTLGVDVLPWQRRALDGAMVWAGDRWASRTVAIIVARQNGKTRLATVRALAGMVLLGDERVVAAAENRDVAIEAWLDALTIAEDAGLDVHDVRRTNGQESFWIGRARYKVAANNRRAARGLSADLVIMDEIREYRDHDGWSALEKTRRARTSSQVWAITTEGDAGSVVLEAIAGQGRAAAEAGTIGDLAFMEWSADPGLERMDPEAWQQANPALGYLISADTIRSESVHDEPATFETEVLCRRVVSLHPWLPAGTWDAAGDQAATVPNGATIALALDAGPELRHATLAVGWRRPDGRAHVEAVAGFGDALGPVLPRAAARLVELLDAWDVSSVAVVARSAAEATATRVLEGLELNVPLVAVSGPDLLRASNGFHEATVARELVHPGDPMSAAHLAAVTADGVLRRRSVAADIDAAVALVLARHGALHAPAVERQDWVAF